MNDFLEEVDFKVKPLKNKSPITQPRKSAISKEIAKRLYKLVMIFISIIVTLTVLRYGCESVISFSMGLPHQTMDDLLERMK